MTGVKLEGLSSESEFLRATWLLIVKGGKMVTVVAIQSAATSEEVAITVTTGCWTFDTVDLVQAMLRCGIVACSRERQWGVSR